MVGSPTVDAPYRGSGFSGQSPGRQASNLSPYPGCILAGVDLCVMDRIWLLSPPAPLIKIPLTHEESTMRWPCRLLGIRKGGPGACHHGLSRDGILAMLSLSAHRASYWVPRTC